MWNEILKLPPDSGFYPSPEKFAQQQRFEFSN
jgi:hypothetical protein